MTNLSSFDHANMTAIAAELKSMVRVISEKYGIDVHLGTGRYEAHQFTFKTTGKIRPRSITGVNVQNVTTEQNAADRVLQNQMRIYNVANMTNAKGDRLIAFNSSSPKYRFTYISAGGKRYKTTVEGAQQRFGRAFGKAAA